MGSSQSRQSEFIWKQFQILERDTKLGVFKLNEKQTDDTYFARQINCSNQKDVMQVERLIDIKLSLHSPYLSKLQKSVSKLSKQYCSSLKIYIVLFKNPLQTLKQESLNRKFKKQQFSQQQLELILQIGVKALYFLKNINHPHRNVSSSSLFITQGRNIIMADPWMFPIDSNSKMAYSTKNSIIYPSPQILKFQKGQIDRYDFHLSDLFTFGIVLMQIYFMNHMDILYDKNFQRANFDAINKKINTFERQSLRKKLFIILEFSPKNRQLIYKQYLKIQTKQHYTQKAREKFKKNIQKYNLATSEVTEWKTTQIPTQRVSSSGGFTSVFGENKHFILQKQFHNTNKAFAQPIFLASNYGQLKKNKQYQIPNKRYQSNFQVNRPFNQSYLRNVCQTNNVQKPVTSYYKFSQQNQLYSIGRQPDQFNQKQLWINKQKYLQPSDWNSQYVNLKTNNINFNVNQKNQEKHNSSQGVEDHLISNKDKNLHSKIKSNQFNYNFLNKIQTNPISKLQKLPQNKNEKISLKNMKPTHQSFQNSQFQQLNEGSGLKIAQSLNLQQNFIPNVQNKQTNCGQKRQQIIQRQILQNISISDQKNYTSSAIAQRLDDIVTQKKSISVASERTPTKFKGQQIHYLSTINERSQKTDSIKSQKQSIRIFTITYQSGTRYEGQMKQDRRNGKGIFYYVDGSRYDGDWQDNKMHGKGTLYYPNNSIAYQGQWLFDNFHGNGMVFNDQPLELNAMYNYQKAFDVDDYWVSYEGQLYQDQRQGRGILRLINGQYFEGLFRNDKLNGLCKFHRINGETIVGEWRDNLMIQQK